jgi:excisionase family DNA binding protein
MNAQDYFTPGQVAKRLRVDRTTVQRWIKQGSLEAETVQQGRQQRFSIKKSSLEAIERRHEHEPLVKERRSRASQGGTSSANAGVSQ